MTCPPRGEVQKLIWDSDKHATRRNPYRQNIHGFPAIIPYGQPVTNRPLAHCMLAYWDDDKSYYIYVKCVHAEDLVMVCNCLVSTRAAGHVELYEITYPYHHRNDYVELAYIIRFERVFPAYTLAEELTNLFLTFRQLVEARGYTFRRYYDDVDADLPVTRFTPWRPKIPKQYRGWHEILNLPFRM